MLSIAVRSVAQASSYYTHMQGEAAGGAASREEYYAAEGAGLWHGEGAAKLGISGPVSAQDFSLLCNGFSTEGTPLVQRAGDQDRRAGWDLTFSAPKSVSLAWANADPDTAASIEKAHAQAVEKALEFVQEKAMLTRRGQGGLIEEKAGMVAATFAHGTSRELDPQLHTHAFILNVATREDGSNGTLQGKHFFDWQKAGGALYRAELSSEMQKLGFAVERDGESFRLPAVSPDAEREFSKRRQQIEAALKDHGGKGARASEKAALSTRKAKDHDHDPEALREQWREAGKEFGLDRIERLPEAQILEREAVAQVLDAAHQNKSVSREQDLYTASFQAAQGAGDAAAARQHAAEAIGAAVHLGAGKDGKARFSTPEIVAAEKHIIQAAQTFDKTAHGIPVRTHQAEGPALSTEQQAAREYMAQAGSLKVLVGDAGTGKSTMLRQVSADHMAAGYSVIGCATAGKAAAGLQESAGIQSQTIASLLRQIDSGESPLHSKSLLVVDEAGMVDSRNLSRLLDAAEAVGAKVALVGDHKQLQPVGSGAVFAALAEVHGDPARLQEIHRQREDWHKQAVMDMSQGGAGKALEQYIDRGAVTIEKTHRAAVQAVAEKVIEARAEVLEDSKHLHPDMAQARAGAEVLAIASTNQAVNDLNTAIRDRLTKSGEITEAREVPTASGKSLEIGQGDRLLITKNEHKSGLKNGDLCTVVGWDNKHPGCIAVRLDRDPQHLTILRPDDLHLKHGFAITTHKAQGATVEKAIVLGSEHTNREVSYVQASRARDSTEWIFTDAKVSKLEQATDREPQRDLPMLDRLKGVVHAMSQSQQKESTLDYQNQKPAPQAHKAAERDGMEM